MSGPAQQQAHVAQALEIANSPHGTQKALPPPADRPVPRPPGAAGTGDDGTMGHPPAAIEGSGAKGTDDGFATMFGVELACINNKNKPSRFSKIRSSLHR